MSKARAGVITHATFDWKGSRRRYNRSLQRLCELAAMSRQPGGMKRALERMRAGDRAVEARRWAVG